MSAKIINLTFPVVTASIENILSNYPEEPYKKAFGKGNLRQELIAYVLSRVPNKYTIQEEGKNMAPVHSPISWEVQVPIELMVYQGIQELLDAQTWGKIG
ncbi:MAG: hypothetical protein Fur0025_04930 [Oscillatoriaceae cyanobacterium]